MANDDATPTTLAPTSTRLGPNRSIGTPAKGDSRAAGAAHVSPIKAIPPAPTWKWTPAYPHRAMRVAQVPRELRALPANKRANGPCRRRRMASTVPASSPDPRMNFRP